MNGIIWALAIAAACLFAGGCSSGTREETGKWMREEGKIRILCTIGMIEDVVRQVGGPYVNTLTLISGQLDPHSYQLVKGDDEKLAAADLIFYNGLGLEHGPSLKHYLTENPKAIGLGNLIKKEDPELILYYNKTPDPHIWLDVQLWLRTVKFMISSLSEKDPLHARDFEERGKAVQEKLLQLHQRLLGEMDKVPQERRFLVTTHDAFNYFARAYLATEEERLADTWQKRFAAPEGLAPESQLSTSHIASLLKHMKKYGIHVLFPEFGMSQASIKKVVNAGNAQGLNLSIAQGFLYSDSMGPFDSESGSYEKMMEHNIKTIVEFLNHGPKHSF